MSEGRTIGGRYRIVDELGRGGVGVVWRAEDLLLQREVALKEIWLLQTMPDAERTQARARLVREARAAARLRSRSVTRVYDLLTDADTAFLVMELVAAPTLRDLVLRDGPLPPARAAAIGLEVLGALDEAHAAGIVHRDVKPGNVMTPPGDVAKLADFGIAAVGGDATLTHTGLVLGSPAYIAPEQARDGRVGPAADLWGLGATLYFAVEGAPPFDRGEPLPTLTAVLTEEPPTPRRAGPLAAAIAALLVKDPSQRADAARARELLAAAAGTGAAPAAGTASAASTATVAAVATDPAPAPAPPPATAPPPVSARPPRPPAQRPQRRLLAALLGGVLLASLAWVVLPLLGGVGGEDPAAPSEPAEPRQRAQRSEAPAVPEDWDRYAIADTGASVAHPPDWETAGVEGSETAVDLRDPDGSTYLRVDYTTEPGPSALGAWEAQEPSFASGRDSYERIAMDTVTYRDWDAALWEYRYGDAGELRAYNLGFVTGSHGFALNLQTTQDQWAEVQPTWEAVMASFRAPPDDR